MYTSSLSPLPPHDIVTPSPCRYSWSRHFMSVEQPTISKCDYYYDCYYYYGCQVAKKKKKTNKISNVKYLALAQDLCQMVILSLISRHSVCGNLVLILVFSVLFFSKRFKRPFWYFPFKMLCSWLTSPVATYWQASLAFVTTQLDKTLHFFFKSYQRPQLEFAKEASVGH